MVEFLAKTREIFLQSRDFLLESCGLSQEIVVIRLGLQLLRETVDVQIAEKPGNSLVKLNKTVCFP